MASKFSFTQSLRGIDFYGPDSDGNPVAISISSNVVASLNIYYPPFNPASISITSNAQSAGLKIATASASLAISCSASLTGTGVLLGSSDLDSQSSVSATGVIGKTGRSVMDGIAFVLSSGLAITPMGEILISPSLNVDNVGFIRFSPSLIEDTQSIRPLIVIDNIPLSEHGRTLDNTLIHSFIENKNWNSRSNRYYKRSNARKTFNISWTYLPGEREYTADLRHGRNKLKEISQDPDLHVLKIRNIDTDGLTPYTEDEYNVLVVSYTETLLRRDESNNVYFWDCNLQLEEV